MSDTACAYLPFEVIKNMVTLMVIDGMSLLALQKKNL